MNLRSRGWGKLVAKDTKENTLTWHWSWRQIQFGLNWHWETPFQRMQPNFSIEFNLLGLTVWYRRQSAHWFKIDPLNAVMHGLMLVGLSLMLLGLWFGAFKHLHQHK